MVSCNGYLVAVSSLPRIIEIVINGDRMSSIIKTVLYMSQRNNLTLDTLVKSSVMTQECAVQT